MCLINVAHEHLITQTGKKSKPALINVMGPGTEGPRAHIWGRGLRAEKKKYPFFFHYLRVIPLLTSCIIYIYQKSLHNADCEFYFIASNFLPINIIFHLLSSRTNYSDYTISDRFLKHCKNLSNTM